MKSKSQIVASPFKDPEKRKQYQQQYHKEKWYPLHREERLKRSRQQRQDLVKWYQDYKKTLRCADCGEDHPATLEFHHLDPSQKEVNVSRLIAVNTSLRKLKEEMAKCVVLCANCHRIRHWNERYGTGEEPDDDLID